MKHSIIPLFIPHYGCSHQCVFCNQTRITGMTTPVTPADVERLIGAYLASGDGARRWEAAFYGGSFTALPMEVMRALLMPAAEALRAGKIQGIRLSTRPDCLSEEILHFLKEMGVGTVELGVQSLDDRVLLAAGRGHTAQDAADGAALLRREGFRVGLQFMAGLPGEDGASLRRTARLGAALSPDFIRIYPVLVLRDTALFRMYETGRYRPLSVGKAAFCCAFLKRWYARHGIPVIRMGLQATDELDRGTSLAAGPYHPSMGELADQIILRYALFRALRGKTGPFSVVCHPKDRSKLMGCRRETWRALEDRFGNVSCREDKAAGPGMLRVSWADGRLIQVPF